MSNRRPMDAVIQGLADSLPEGMLQQLAEAIPESVWEGAETAEWTVRRLLQLHLMPAQFYTEPRPEEEGGLWSDCVYEFPVLAVAVAALFLLGNLLRATLFSLAAWLLTAPAHGAPRRERLRLDAWALCWHAFAAAIAMHAVQPMCTTEDNTDDVELPEGLSRVGCEAGGHTYQPGLSPLLGAVLVPAHSWGVGGADGEGGSLAAVLLGQGEWPAQRVPIRVHALLLWQLAAVVERALGAALGDYPFRAAQGLEAAAMVGFMCLAHATGNAAPGVAILRALRLPLLAALHSCQQSCAFSANTPHGCHLGWRWQCFGKWQRLRCIRRACCGACSAARLRLVRH